MDRLQTILLLAATLVAAPLQAQELKSGDAKKLSKPISNWVEAKIEGDFSGQAEAQDELFKALESVNKKLKGKDALSLVKDWEVLFESGRNYPTSGSFVKKGKLTKHDFIGFDYMAWLPAKYNPKKFSYPTILLLTDGDREAIAGLPEDVLNQCIILAPDINGLGATEPQELMRAQIRMLGTAVQGISHFRVERNRLFLVGDGDLGAPAAADIAAAFPQFFGGLAVVGAPAAATVGNANLSLLPTTGDLADLAGAVNWCLAAEPRMAYPESFKFELVREWAGKAFWVQAVNFDVSSGDDVEPSTMDVSVDRATNTITINTTGVYTLKIFLNDLIVNLDEEVTIVRNGVPYSAQFSRSLGTVIESYEQAYDAGAVFTARLNKLDVPLAEETGDEGN